MTSALRPYRVAVAAMKATTLMTVGAGARDWLTVRRQRALTLRVPLAGERDDQAWVPGCQDPDREDLMLPASPRGSANGLIRVRNGQAAVMNALLLSAARPLLRPDLA
ncbi:MAG: hypothetical protein ABIO17_02500 [Pseudoxanthomonas sp.]